jgi:hypothetical protein
MKDHKPAAREAYGEESVRYANYLDWLADVYLKAGNASAAEVELRQALAILARIGEGRTADAASVRASLAAALMAKGALGEAESLLQAVIAEDESVLASSHWTHVQAESMLGALLGARGDFERGEPMLTSSFDRFMSARVPREFRVSAAQRLVSFYEAWDAAAPGTGKAELAAQWREKERELASPR